jgi:hypothetical protein
MDYIADRQFDSFGPPPRWHHRLKLRRPLPTRRFIGGGHGWSLGEAVDRIAGVAGN